MIGIFAAGTVAALLLLAAMTGRLRASLRTLTTAALVLAALVAVAPGQSLAASGTTLFSQTFANNTATGVSKPSSPNGTNYACLTASGNSSTTPLLSCSGNNDTNGSGKLRLTAASTSQEGGVFSATSVPTSQGLDATFNSYQYGGNGADGIAFVLAAVDPANPVVPSTIGQPGGSLGYSAYGVTSGLADAYMGIGLDVFGNFSNSTFQGSGCTNPAYISTTGAGAGPGGGARAGQRDGRLLRHQQHRHQYLVDASSPYAPAPGPRRWCRWRSSSTRPRRRSRPRPG